MLRRLSTSLLLKLVILLWLGCAVFGFGCLGRLDRSAGASGQPPAQWQRSPHMALDPVALDPVKPTLKGIMPACPKLQLCSAAGTRQGKPQCTRRLSMAVL